MTLLVECMLQRARKALGTGDIVTDGDLTPTEPWSAAELE